MPKRPFRRPLKAAAIAALFVSLVVPPGIAAGQTIGGSDLGIEKTGPESVVAGGSFSYTLTVTNLGSLDNVHGYVVTDELPDGLDLESAEGCASEDVEGVETVTCEDTDGIAADEGVSESFTLDVSTDPALAPGEAAIVNTASVEPAGGSFDDQPGNDSSTWSSDVTAEADLFPTLSGPEGDQVAGTSFGYTLTVGNAGPSDHAGGFDASFTLPAGFSFAGGEGCAANEGDVTCSGTSIAAGGEASFTVDTDIAPSVFAGSHDTSGVSVSSSGTTDPVSENDASGAASVSVVTSADLSITKEGSPNPVTSGADVTYAVEVTNGGPSDAQGVTLSDELPASLTDGRICEVTLEVDCADGGQYSAFDGSEDLGTMAAGSARSFRIRATVASDTPPGDNTLENTATVSSATSDPATPNNGVDFTSTITEADLSASLAGPEGTVIAGDDAGFDYTLTVDNDGPSDNTGGYAASFELPGGFSFGEAGPNGACSATGSTVTCTNETGIVAGGADDYTIHATVAPSVQDDTYDTTATVETSGTIDPNEANDTSAASVEVITRADLTVSLAGPEGEVIAGDDAGFDYTMAVDNAGPSDNSDGGYSASFTLPAGFSFSASGSTAGCSAAGQVVTCSDTGGIAAGGSKEFTVHVDVASSVQDDTYTTSATVSSDGTVDPDTGNDTSGDASVVVITRADLSPTLSTAATPRIAGAQAGFDYTLSIHNGGPSDNSDGGYEASFTLPTGTAFASTGTTAGCTAAGQVVTCTDPSGIVADGTDESYTVHAVIAASTADGTYGTAASVASLGTVDPVAGNDTSNPAAVNVITRADLSITKSAQAQLNPPTLDLAFANANSSQNRVTFTIVVANAAASATGPSDAQAVTVTDTLPTDTSFVSASSADCSHTSGTVTCSNAAPLVPGASRTYTIVVSVNDTLRGGEANNFTNTAGVTSTTLDIDGDPYPKTTTSGAIRVHTVPNAPTGAHTDSGNTNAVVSWTPTPAANNGGEPITEYRVTLTPTSTQPSACPNPGTLTTVVRTVAGAAADKLDTGTNSLRNDCEYSVVVQARNAVGYSDVATSDTTATPSPDKSAEILGNGNNVQFTGTGNPSSSDPVTTTQRGTFSTGTVGTLEEITDSVSTMRASYFSTAQTVSPSTFCGGLPCAAGTVVLNKLTDQVTGADGRYIIELEYGKQVTFGTGQKRVYFDDLDPTLPADNPVDGPVQISTCPKQKKGQPAPILPDACIVKLTANASKNPAVLVWISVNGAIIDPLSGTRR